MIRYLLMILGLFAAVAACDSGGRTPVVATNVVITAPAPGMPVAAGYLEISNHSGTAIRITRVSSPDYESVEMHETVVEEDVARMRAIPLLEIEDGGTVVFERGGKHLMLMRPIGTPDTVTLNFYSDEILLLSVSAEFTTAVD